MLLCASKSSFVANTEAADSSRERSTIGAPSHVLRRRCRRVHGGDRADEARDRYRACPPEEPPDGLSCFCCHESWCLAPYLTRVNSSRDVNDVERLQLQGGALREVVDS